MTAIKTVTHSTRSTPNIYNYTVEWLSQVFLCVLTCNYEILIVNYALAFNNSHYNGQRWYILCGIMVDW